MRNVVVVVAALAVLGALGGGFYLIGPPADERARRIDARRQNDLQQLSGVVDVYWTRHNRLPESLDEISRESGADVYARDPERGEVYEYRQTVSRQLRTLRHVYARLRNPDRFLVPWCGAPVFPHQGTDGPALGFELTRAQ